MDRVLATAPGVRILTTSREPLSMAGEAIYPVPPLATPSVEDDLRFRTLNASNRLPCS